MSKSFKSPLPEFKLNLLLPRKNYVLGERINYEVIVENTDGRPIEFLTITLLQNMLEAYTKRRGMRSELKRSFKYSTNRIAHRSTGPGYPSTSWMDFLQIPNLIPPSLTMGTVNLSDKPVQAVEIQYILKVHAIQCESFSIPSEDFPIIIQKERNPNGTGPSNSASNLHTGTVLPSYERSRRTGFESIERTPQHFPLRRLGLGPNDPPRYSTLSLNTQTMGYGSPGCYTSWETLPPDYDDVAFLQ